MVDHSVGFWFYFVIKGWRPTFKDLVGWEQGEIFKVSW